MKIKKRKSEIKGFHLKFLNGMKWSIISTENTREWVEQFAEIYGLKRGSLNDGCKIIVFRSETGQDIDGKIIQSINDETGCRLPVTGWYAETHGQIIIWSHDFNKNKMINIGKRGSEYSEILKMQLSFSPVIIETERSGGLLLHAALASFGGKGVLCLAPGGGGKSTCASRLPAQWDVLGDDLTLAVYDINKGFLSHPLPTWSRLLSERKMPQGRIMKCAPLSAAFFVQKSDMDWVLPMGQAETAFAFTQAALQALGRSGVEPSFEVKRTWKQVIFGNACKLASQIPAYRLQASLTGRFWEKIEAVLEWSPQAKEQEEESEGVIYERRSGT